MNNTVVASVVFPANADFIQDFFDSLSRQTYKDFDVLIINDGLEDFDLFVKEYRSLRIIEYKYSDSPAKIRQKLIGLLFDSKYKNIIFSDSDDYLSDNRVEESIKYLNRYPIVFNDLTSFCVDTIFEKNIWQSRFIENKVINKKFLLDKNVLGLGNTSVRKEILKKIDIAPDLIAIDWAIFYNLIDDFEAFFIQETQTFYRQHNANTVGHNKVSKQRIEAALKVKKAHYDFIKRKDLLEKMISLEEKLNAKCEIDKKEKQLKINQGHNYFWWEETEILEK